MSYKKMSAFLFLLWRLQNFIPKDFAFFPIFDCIPFTVLKCFSTEFHLETNWLAVFNLFKSFCGMASRIQREYVFVILDKHSDIPWNNLVLEGKTHWSYSRGVYWLWQYVSSSFLFVKSLIWLNCDCFRIGQARKLPLKITVTFILQNLPLLISSW